MTQKIEPNLELSTLFMMLRDHGASHVVVDFQGSGDGGSFEDMYAIPSSLVDEDGSLKHREWESEFTELHKGMPAIPQDKRNLIEDVADNYTKSYDWWNNDGGDGYIVINLETFDYYTHYSINTMTSENFSEQGKVTVE